MNSSALELLLDPGLCCVGHLNLIAALRAAHAGEASPNRVLVERSINGVCVLSLWRYGGAYLATFTTDGVAAEKIPWQPVSRKLAAWVDEHGSVAVGNGDGEKTRGYLKWLIRLGYCLVPLRHDDYGYAVAIAKTGLSADIARHVLATS